MTPTLPQATLQQGPHGWGGTSPGAQGSHVSCGTWAALKFKFNSKMKQYGRLSFSQFYLFHNLPVLLH